VVGAAQIGHAPRSHCQTPPSHLIESMHSRPHSSPGVLHGVPAEGAVMGQLARGLSQNQLGGAMGLQTGYCVPPWQSLHQQWVPSAYQQDDWVSEHWVEFAGGGVKHEGGSGGALQSAGLGRVTCHLPLSQRAVVRHAGRGSSPHVQ
jgi:hypothetical protein